MRKTSLMLGLLLSGLLHALVFLPALSDARRAEPQRERAADDGGKLTVMRTPAPQPMEPAAPPVPEENRQVPAPEPVEAPRLKELEKVADTSADMEDVQDMGDMVAESDSESLPRLRILWSSPEELRSVARFFGMKVIALDSHGNILGQVSLEGVVRLEPSEGNLTGFSNRVRALPSDFFGQSLPRAARSEIRDFWVLVPAGVDARFLTIQEDAIRRRGLQPSEVAAVEARFTPAGRGRYSLVITDVISL